LASDEARWVTGAEIVVDVDIPAVLYNETKLKAAILAVLWMRDFIDECAAFPGRSDSKSVIWTSSLPQRESWVGQVYHYPNVPNVL
jgi:hypothetical protein